MPGPPTELIIGGHMEHDWTLDMEKYKLARRIWAIEAPQGIYRRDVLVNISTHTPLHTAKF